MSANPHRGHHPLLQAKHHISSNRTLYRKCGFVLLYHARPYDIHTLPVMPHNQGG